MDDYYNINKIIEIGINNDWELIDHQQNIGMLIFKRGTSKINVYYTKMTVATVVDHPIKGRNQMYRKHVSINLLKRIFKNPRIHTSSDDEYHGYHFKE